MKSWLDCLLTIAKEADWLYEKFGEGEYDDVRGLCKIAGLEEILEKGYSLTSGALASFPTPKRHELAVSGRAVNCQPVWGRLWVLTVSRREKFL